MNPVNTTAYELPSDVWLVSPTFPDHNPNILEVALDVTLPESVSAAFAYAANHFGENFYLDVVEMEILFFGTARVTMCAVEVMQQAEDHRGGLIVNISSFVGLCAFPGHAYYHAGKFAVEGFTESVISSPAAAVHFGIIEPSSVKTNFEGYSKAYIKPHPAYADPSMPSRQLEKYVSMGLKSGVGLEPKAVAKTIWNIASRGEKIPLRISLGCSVAADHAQV
ncbi:short-chain dehydrogenase/reductase-like protein SDR [Lasiosphaeria hispida]|uniref:Short-chain dehydrogenase/reductase-like protein SDR n=1 Tax=Lasiosphaeria hispida TaxID=260671 RepID=A0AAJ0HKF4_9PEZI|nr:short-chain dehydrogenase/reductase-like protein SDR [Lasiosphaeria hispida]